MPVNQSMMDNMVKQYGSEKGKSVYYAMENKMKTKVKKTPGRSKAILKNKMLKMFNTTK